MKSKKLQRNSTTGILVGECICKNCENRIDKNFLSCSKRVSITRDIILGNTDCQYYKKCSG